MCEDSRSDLIKLLASTAALVRVITHGRDVRIPAAQASALAIRGDWKWLSSKGHVTKMREIAQVIPIRPVFRHQSSAFGPWPGWWERQKSGSAIGIAA
jgi:hypothetical protein